MSVRSSILFCTNCPLHEQVYSPVPYSGPAPNPFIVIGEAPGVEEDKYMQPFIGKSGRLLRSTLDNIAGGDFSEALSYMNVVCCYPSGTPRQQHIQACRDNMTIQLDELEPRFALVLGGVALNALLPPSNGGLSVNSYRGVWVRLRAAQGPLGRSTLGLVTWHPSYVLRSGGLGSSQGLRWQKDLAQYVEACYKFKAADSDIVDLSHQQLCS